MNQSLQDQVLSQYDRDEIDTFRDNLEQLTLIDLGVITAYDNEGYCTVQMYRYCNHTPIVYEHVELLYIGNAGGIVEVSPVGALCLLFIPQTVWTDTYEMILSPRAPAYDIRGAKALPVTNGRNSHVKMTINSLGHIVFTGEDYNLVFADKSVQLSDANDIMRVTFDNDGSLNHSFGKGLTDLWNQPDGTDIEMRHNSDGIIYYLETKAPDGTITIKRNAYETWQPADYDDFDSFVKWQWIETFKPDGTRDILQQDEQQNPLFHTTIDPDGTSHCVTPMPINVSITNDQGEEQVGIVLNNDGTITMTQKSDVTETIEGNSTSTIKGDVDNTVEGNSTSTIKGDVDNTVEGTLTVTVKKDASVTLEGKCSVTVKGDAEINVNGKTNVTSTGDVTLDTKGTMTLKNAISSLGALIDTFIQAVQTLDTVGSPASHSAGPGIISNMISLKTQWDQVFK